MAVKKKVTEIRDDVFFRKLLDVSKNAVFIGWSGIYREEYQSLLKDNLPYLRELSIIKNAGFESTGISVALYVFSEKESGTYVSRVYDGSEVVYEEEREKDDEPIQPPSVPIPKEDLRPKMSDFFKTVCDYKEWETKQALNKRLEEIKAWENSESEKLPWEDLKEERVDWEQGGNAMLSDLSFRNYLKSVRHDLMIFGQCGDVSILETLATNLDELADLGRKVRVQLEVYRTVENAFSETSKLSDLPIG